MVKMKDVAEKAGVSVATVSNVFTGKHFVSPEVKERVLKAVDALNYHINLNARGLKTSRTKSIGVVLPDMTKLFFNEVLRGILESAESHGYRIMVLNSYYDFSIEKECISYLRSSNVDGIILDSCCDYHELKKWANELALYEGRYTPIVFLETSMDDALVSSVSVDTYYWSSRITKYLISKGKRKILYISGPLHLRHEYDRLSGYEHALKDSGLKVQDNLIIKGNYSPNFSYHLVNELLRKPPKFDAIQASNDEAAIGAIKALKEHGYNVPESIMVCGFDNLFPATLVEPSITTINVPRCEIGVEAVTECIHHIEDPSLPHRCIVLSANMVQRGSTESNIGISWELAYW